MSRHTRYEAELRNHKPNQRQDRINEALRKVVGK